MEGRAQMQVMVNCVEHAGSIIKFGKETHKTPGIRRGSDVCWRRYVGRSRGKFGIKTETLERQEIRAVQAKIKSHNQGVLQHLKVTAKPKALRRLKRVAY